MKNDTVENILKEDNLNQIASKIVDKEIDNIIIIYKDKVDNKLKYATTCDSYATIYGEIVIAKYLVDDEFDITHEDEE
jgi:hypothetical protein